RSAQRPQPPRSRPPDRSGAPGGPPCRGGLARILACPPVPEAETGASSLPAVRRPSRVQPTSTHSCDEATGLHLVGAISHLGRRGSGTDPRLIAGAADRLGYGLCAGRNGAA